MYIEEPSISLFIFSLISAYLLFVGLLVLAFKGEWLSKLSRLGRKGSFLGSYLRIPSNT